jgi:hypothetical protein
VFPRSAVELPRSAVGPPRFGVRHSPIEASVTSSSSSSSARPVFIAPRLISARSPPVVADPVARSPPSRFVGLDLLSADSFIGRHRGHFAPSSPTALRPAARLLLLVGDVFPPAAASLAPPSLYLEGTNCHRGLGEGMDAVTRRRLLLGACSRLSLLLIRWI